MGTWTPPTAAVIYGSTVLTLAFIFLFFGGRQRMRKILFPESHLSTPTLRTPLLPFGFGLCLLGLTAWLAPSLLPGTALALGLWMLSFSKQQPLSFWGLRQTRAGSDLRLALVTLLTFLIPILLLLALSSGLIWTLGWPWEPQPALLRFLEARDAKTLAPFLIYALIIAPAWEEIFFRGTLFPWLSSRIPANQAHWLSALAFGAVHLHGPTLIPLTFLGAVLVGMYRTSHSLVPCFLLHSLFNANTCILLLLAHPPLTP